MTDLFKFEITQIAGLSAIKLLAGDKTHSPKLALKMAILVASIIAPLQIVVGDAHGLNTLEYEPTKIASIEANWDHQDHVPLVVFAIPDEKTHKNNYEIAIPDLASLVLTHSISGKVPEISKTQAHPPVSPIFFSFRTMVAIGMLMLLTSWVGLWYWIKRKENYSKIYLWAMALMTFSGWFATIAGWNVTEIGRQPWLVQSVLLTQDAISTQPPANIAISLTLYSFIYGGLLLVFMYSIVMLSYRQGKKNSTESFDQYIDQKGEHHV